MQKIKIQLQLTYLLLISGLLVFAGCKKDDPTNCDNGNVFTINGGISCDNTPTAQSVYSTTINGANRDITFNYVPPHMTKGQVVPNQKTWSVPANPIQASSTTEVANTAFTGTSGYLGYVFGIANTGVPFDPVANEPWVNTKNGDVDYAWNLEILSTAHDLIYDCNNAHDPNRYHYHGTPVTYLANLEDGSTHSGLFGYAADGFPIYYKYGYTDPNDAGSAIKALTSSYSLKTGCRPGDGVTGPDGGYDGTYVADYEYVEGKGDLDECNGRWSKTPEFPNGTYVYYITDQFPSVPRCFVGTPSIDFRVD
ncbi:MAG: YHYH protein [Bacteroidia bacterium]|nr:YHYH protein [Bacteroidia bacterium]